MKNPHNIFMQQAIALARQGVSMGHGGPFGAVVTIDNEIIGMGWNQVIHRNDPTAHAEILAIRDACQKIGHFHLSKATLYTTCEPCPMCMGAAYWAHIGSIYYGANRDAASAAGFDDRHISDELRRPLHERDISAHQHLEEDCRSLLQSWASNENSIKY